LEKIDYPDHKIVLVDNGSNNNEADIIAQKYPGIHLIRNRENRGIPLATNQGIEFGLARGADYILFLNNDTIVKPDFLSILVDYAEKHEEAGAVGPKMLYYNSDKIWFNGGMVYWWLGFNRHLERSRENGKSVISSPKEVDYITGCCVLMRREALEKAGLLDPIYFTQYEDVDWCWRIKKLGFKNIVVPESVIWHKVSSSLGQQASQRLSKLQAYYVSRNAIIFARKHLSGFKKFVFLTAQFTLRLGVNLILCRNNHARIEYFRGLIAGFDTRRELRRDA